MAASQLGFFNLLILDANGSPAVSGRVYTYTQGTTTKKTAYTDAAASVAHTYTSDLIGGEYIALNARGELPAPLFGTSGAYDIHLKTSAGATVWTRRADPMQGVGELAASSGASLVSWIRAAASAVAYTLGEWLGWQKPNALEFMTVAQRINVLARTGTADVTTPIIAAMTASVTEGRELEWPGGKYKITDSLPMPAHLQMRGEHRSAGSTLGTHISFEPTSVKSLFTMASAAALQDGFSIDGFLLSGNSVASGGNSWRAIDCVNVINSRFSNIRINGFTTGVRVEGTINNRFEYIRIANCYDQCISYTGNNATTDVWEQPYLSNAPIGVQTNGTSLGIRFNKPIFESITTYGLNLVRECYGWRITGTYAEDTPSANVATNALFRVGFDGTTLAASQQLQISGGHMGGRNAGGVGSLLTVDYTDGVTLGGFNAARYTNVVTTSANTQTNQIIALGWTMESVSAPVSDATKVIGFYATAAFNSGSRNDQTVNFNSLGTEYTAASTACTGAITTAVIWKATKAGHMVTLTLPSTVGVASAAAYFEYGVVLPTAFRPTASLGFACQIKDNDINVSVPGLLYIFTTGVIRVYRDMTAATNFTAGANAGLGQSLGTSVSWTV